MEAWYALHSKPNAEYQVAMILTQQGIETYLPEIEVAKKQRAYHKKPFFPCYLFCRVDLNGRIGGRSGRKDCSPQSGKFGFLLAQQW